MTDHLEAPERDILPVASARHTWAALGRLVRPHRVLAFAALFLLIAATCVGLLVSPLLGHMVDLIVDRRGAGSMTVPAILLATAAIGQGILIALGTSTFSRLGEVLLSRLRESFVERAVELPLGQLERAGSGDLSSRITNDVNKISDALRYAVPQFIRSCLVIALTLVGLGLLDWRFMVAAAVAVPLQFWTARWYVRRSQPLYARHRTIIGDQQHQLLNTIGGAATVRALRITDDHEHQVERRSRANADLGIAEIMLQTRFFNRLNLAEMISLTSVLLTGFWLVRAGSVTIGAATAAALYFHALMGPITGVLFLFDKVQMATVSLARLIGVIELETEAPRPVSRAAGTPASVSVKAVAHSYEAGHPVLIDVDLDLPAGTRTALVGASGAGKTTLAKLVAGVHQPTDGTVSITGADDSFRQVVLITQEVHTFAGPLSDDLRLAQPGASDASLHAALTKVGALEWALALPEGLATAVGADGHQLTAAQAQQIALARLILIDPPVAILDEATAEAGSAGARILEQAAEAALEGRTALVVAHRLTQAATADQIVVLDHGRVVESGTHDALVAAGGRYAELWSAWSGTRV